MYFIVPCALHHCIYSLTIVTLIASDPICSWMKPEMYTVLSTAPGSLNPCPSFLLLSLLCRRWVCVFSFFYRSSKDLISPKFWCQAIVLWSLFSVCFHLVLNSQALGTSSLSSKKRKKNPAMPNILERDRMFPGSFKRKMQKGSYFLLPTHQQFAPDFFPPGDLKVSSGIASSSSPYAPPPPRVYTWPLLRFFLWGFC